VGTFGITRDVTSQKKAEEELKRNDAMISKLSEQVPGFFYLYHQKAEDTAGFPYASAGIRDIYELNPEDVKETIAPIASRIHEEDLSRVIQSIQESFQTLKKWEIDFRVVLPKKGLRWVRGKARPERQPDGSVIGYGYITDITEEKETFESIVRLRKQLQQVIDSAPNLIFIKNIDGKYLMANESAATFFGESIDTIVGKTDLEIGISKERAQRFIENDKLVIDSKEAHHMPEESTTLPDGSKVWHQTIKVPFFNTDSGKPAVLSVVTDITQLKKKEIELNSTLDIIGEQNKHLMNFAHIVSHNLRNHAGNISMLLSLYDMEESDVEKEELLEHLGVASKRLNESISDLNEIIDQQNSTKGERKVLNIKETVHKIEEILTTERLANNVTIQKEIPADLSLKYNPAYLESIILNLLSNAIKYRHPDRKPEVSVKAEEREGSVHLEISDNGLGIDLEKHREKLFGMYNTFHQNKNSKGIGLFITKNQIESMGGSIDVQSKPNEGTTFKIKLS
jgi:PAS domain S-box-containing protein